MRSRLCQVGAVAAIALTTGASAATDPLSVASRQMERSRALAASDAEGARAAAAAAAAEYARAIESLDHRPNAELLRALGNAHLRSGRTGHAVLAYRRAVAADPSNAAANESLTYARSLLPASTRGPGAAEVVARGWIDRVPLPPAGPTLWVGATAWAVAWGVLTARRVRHGRLRGSAAVATAGVCVAAGAAAAAGLLAWRTPPDASAVVTEAATARSGPSDAVYPAVFTEPLPPGVEGFVLEERDGWVRLALAGGQDAWLPRTSIEMVHELPAGPQSGAGRVSP